MNMNTNNRWRWNRFPNLMGRPIVIDTRRARILNALLISTLLVSLVFAIINNIIDPMNGVTIINALSALLSLLTLIFFKLTRKYHFTAYVTVGIISICMLVYLHIVQNQYFSFIWITVIPPIAYYLLGNRSATVLIVCFNGYVLLYLLTHIGKWQPAVFDEQSFISIAAASLCVTGMLAIFVKNQNEVLDELRATGIQLQNQQNDLRLILDSAAEAIYGVDLEGKCTFCNRRCVEMLGYQEPSDLIGKNMHWQIHHSRGDGTPFPIADCIIYSAIRNGVGAHIEDEVFWRADHTSIAVEYHSYPQIKDGEIIGAVITFTDITERKKRESEIEYLNCYDMLTGLHNRRCFEENQDKLDIQDNLPISVIFADLNGLKMTNDIFGHAAGDKLIKKSAEILVQACRQHDLIARVGGDEFIILLPRTTREDAEKVLIRIRSGFLDARVEAIKCSIALGLDTKQNLDQPLEEVLSNAENAMYRDKTMNRRATDKDLIDTIIESLHSRNAKEKDHSEAVSELCYDVGVAMHLPETDISKLHRAGYLHDIGKITLDEAILSKEKLNEDALERMQQHSAIGYRILSLFDDTLDLAEYVYGHHEKWDGTGYPRGLQGEQISLISRVIAITETYDRIVNRDHSPAQDQEQHALDIISERAGTQFDPEIAMLFVQLMRDKGSTTHKGDRTEA